MTGRNKSSDAQLPENRKRFQGAFQQALCPIVHVCLLEGKESGSCTGNCPGAICPSLGKKERNHHPYIAPGISLPAVLHASLNYLKHSGIVERTHLRISESDTEQPVQPDTLAEEGELYETLVAVLEKLPVRTRVIFEKIRFEGKKYREVADELQISVKNRGSAYVGSPSLSSYCPPAFPDDFALLGFSLGWRILLTYYRVSGH